MILVVAPEPPTWLGLVEAECTVVVAPRWLRLGLRVWARRRADRRIRARFLMRSAADRIASRRLGGMTAVFAAGLAAHRTFAKARAAEIRTVLVEDLPDLQRLHDDLDRAALVHPDARFLRRYRARREVVVRQGMERALADEVVTREQLISPVVSGPRRTPSAAPTMLLAGPATARGGLYEAVALADALPESTLAIQVGEGMEPADALQHANVRAATRTEREQLDGIDIVIAPAWCEADLPEVPMAMRLV